MKSLSIVFIPGLLCDERVWSPVYNAMSENFPCYIAMWESGDTLPVFIERVLNMSKGPLVIFGHSMGGVLSLSVALYAPERVIGLCVVNSSADADSIEEKEARINMMKAYQLYNDCSLIEEFAKKSTLKPSDAVLSMMLSNQDRLISQQCFLSFRDMSLEKLADIQCPVLLIHSDYDYIKSQDHSKRMNNHLTNSIFKIIEKSGHMIPMEQPDSLIRISKSWMIQSII